MVIKTALWYLSLAALVGAVEPPTPMVAPLNYTHNGTDLQGFLSVPEGNMTDLLPAVVIIPYVRAHDLSCCYRKLVTYSSHTLSFQRLGRR